MAGGWVLGGGTLGARTTDCATVGCESMVVDPQPDTIITATNMIANWCLLLLPRDTTNGMGPPTCRMRAGGRCALARVDVKCVFRKVVAMTGCFASTVSGRAGEEAKASLQIAVCLLTETDAKSRARPGGGSMASAPFCVPPVAALGSCLKDLCLRSDHAEREPGHGRFGRFHRFDGRGPCDLRRGTDGTPRAQDSEQHGWADDDQEEHAAE